MQSLILNKNSLKESFASYLLTERNKNLYNNNFAFNSFDKTTNRTAETFRADICNRNISKFNIQNLKTIKIAKTKKRNKSNLKLAHSPKDQINFSNTHIRQNEQPIKSPLNTHTNNLLDLSSEHDDLSSPTPRRASNVMNIVNNLSTVNGNQVGRNKNVEINFNKYEIKILSTKPTSHSIQIKKQTQQQKHQNKQEEEKSNYKIKIINNEEIKANTNTSNTHIKQNIKKTSLVIKTSSSDNESSDATSSHLIFLKPQFIKVNNVNQKETIDNEHHKKKNSLQPNMNTQNLNNVNHSLHVQTNTHQVIKQNSLTPIFFRNNQIISNECQVTFFKEKKATGLSIDANPLIKLINTRNSLEDSDEDDNNLSGLILGHKNNYQTLQLKNLSYEKEKGKSSFNSSINSFKKGENDEKEINNLSIIMKPTDLNYNTQKEEENTITSSFDITINKTKKYNTFDKCLNLSPIRKCYKTLMKTDIEPFNKISSTFNSSLNLKQKDGSVTFLSNKGASLLLSPRKQEIKPNRIINQSKQKNQLKSQKNKFLRQLTKISEIYKRKTPKNQLKVKLFQSLSSPLLKIKIRKTSINDDCIQKQLSFTKPKSNPFNNTLQSSSLLFKKKSVIKEMEKYSQSEQSIKLSTFSLIEDKSDQDIDFYKFQKGSMISKSRNSVNFVDLRTYSVRIANDISKCSTLMGRSFCHSFIQKQINELEMEYLDIEENAKEEKDNFLNKIMLAIDIKSERIKERGHRTLTQYACGKLRQIETHKRIQIQDIIIPSLHYFNENTANQESDFINEYEFLDHSNNSYVFSSNTILLSDLNAQYFQFSLLYHLNKEKYLQQPIGINPGTFLPNFSKKRKILKRQRTSLSSVNSNTSRSKKQKRQYHLMSNKYHLEVIYGINAAFCFRFIKKEDISFENKENNEKTIEQKIHLMKTSSVSDIIRTLRKKDSRKNVLLNPRKRTQLFINNPRLSYCPRKSIDNQLTPFHSLQRKDSILQKCFYSRNKELQKKIT